MRSLEQKKEEDMDTLEMGDESDEANAAITDEEKKCKKADKIKSSKQVQ